jgi:hypothetical protein
MSDGNYCATITIASNDPVNASIELEANLDVSDVSNHVPLINLPEDICFEKNRMVVLNVADYSSDPDSDPLSVQIAGNTNVLYEITGLSVRLTATQNWVGSETLTVIVSDGELSSSDQILVTVLPVNVPDWDVVNYPNNPATIYATVNIIGYPVMANDMLAAFETRNAAELRKL